MNEDLVNLVTKALCKAWSLGKSYESSSSSEDVIIEACKFISLVKDTVELVRSYKEQT